MSACWWGILRKSIFQALIILRFFISMRAFQLQLCFCDTCKAFLWRGKSRPPNICAYYGLRGQAFIKEACQCKYWILTKGRWYLLIDGESRDGYLLSILSAVVVLLTVCVQKSTANQKAAQLCNLERQHFRVRSDFSRTDLARAWERVGGRMWWNGSFFLSRPRSLTVRAILHSNSRFVFVWLGEKRERVVWISMREINPSEPLWNITEIFRLQFAV